jgi:hypothetical protein
MNQFAPPQKVTNKGREPSKTTHGNNTTSRPMNASIDHILLLHQTIGNQAVQRMIKSGVVQLKDSRPQPGDAYSREINQLAKRVQSIPPGQVQAKTATSSDITSLMFIVEPCSQFQTTALRKPTNPGDQEKAGGEKEPAAENNTAGKQGGKCEINEVSPGPKALSELEDDDAGLTFPENIEISIDAIPAGDNWQAKVTSIKGNYSITARLLPHQKEITGSEGDTTEENYKAQVNSLRAWQVHTSEHEWYVLEAVIAHEEGHLTHFLPALLQVEQDIINEFAKITVPKTPDVDNPEAAAAAIKNLPAFDEAINKARDLWEGAIFELTDKDHYPGGAAYEAEKKVIDQRYKKIEELAIKKGWQWPLPYSIALQ